jgi:hypothetical protein
MLMKSGGALPRAEAERATRTPVGINVGLGAGAVVLAALIAAGIPAGHEAWRWGVIAGGVALFGAVTADELALLAVVPLGWLVANGFLENRLGVLTWHGSRDLSLILLLAVAAGLGWAAGEAYRLRRASRDS